MPKTAPRAERTTGAADSNQNNCHLPLSHNVPPEQINNFVYESPQDRLVMDFGEIKVCLYLGIHLSSESLILSANFLLHYVTLFVQTFSYLSLKLIGYSDTLPIGIVLLYTSYEA